MHYIRPCFAVVVRMEWRSNERISEGRASAIFVGRMEEMMSEPATRKPAESKTFDLIVIGGGLAGLCAAIAAARNGTNTALIHDRPVFGGNASSEIRIVPLGAGTGAAWNAETGIVHELVLKDRAVNHTSFFDHGMANSIFVMTNSVAGFTPIGLGADLYRLEVRRHRVRAFTPQTGCS
jgi:hypothetical protein